VKNNEEKQKTSGRFPAWLKKRLPSGAEAAHVRQLLSDLNLATVCSGAHCPNQAECFARGTATFMILGEVCTRSCGFCAIPCGQVSLPREDESRSVAEAAARMKLKHVVITSVTRDDLSDGGAGYFAKTIQEVRKRLPQSVIEVLTPDFKGDEQAIETVLSAAPEILNHNVETIPRLYERVRPQAEYKRSLYVLKHADEWRKKCPTKLYTKSGLMVGLGETNDEVLGVMRDLREVGCDILTIGQYLSPSEEHLPVKRFVQPAEFEQWKLQAKEMGFRAVASSPFTRSSYYAESLFSSIGH